MNNEFPLKLLLLPNTQNMNVVVGLDNIVYEYFIYISW